jgi:hypothetical protein
LAGISSFSFPLSLLVSKKIAKYCFLKIPHHFPCLYSSFVQKLIFEWLHRLSRVSLDLLFYIQLILHAAVRTMTWKHKPIPIQWALKHLPHLYQRIKPLAKDKTLPQIDKHFQLYWYLSSFTGFLTSSKTGIPLSILGILLHIQLWFSLPFFKVFLHVKSLPVCSA